MPNRELRPTVQDLEVLVAQLCKENPLIEANLKTIILERLLREAEAKQGAPELPSKAILVQDEVAEQMQKAWAKD